MEHANVVGLSLGEKWRRKRIGPALIVPVIHVLLESDDLYAGDRLVLLKGREQAVRRRAGRAALGCEKLYDYGSGGLTGASFRLRAFA